MVMAPDTSFYFFFFLGPSLKKFIEVLSSSTLFPIIKKKNMRQVTWPYMLQYMHVNYFDIAVF